MGDKMIAGKNNFGLIKTVSIHVILSLAIAYVILPFIGGPTSWDELLYLDLSIFPYENPIVLFRYGHVYLQKVFISFFDNKILGASFFWAVIMVSTLLQTIRLAFKLSKKNYLIAGVAGLFLFTSNIIFQKYVGVTYPDFTIMFLGVSMLTIYYADVDKTIRTILISFLFIYALKTKETSLAFILIPIADILGYERNELRKGGYNVIIGILSSLLLFVILDFIYLGELFFSFNPNNLRKRVGYDLSADTFDGRSAKDYLSFLVKGSMGITVVFYFKQIFSQKTILKNKLVMLIPVLYLMLLIVSSIKGAWGIEDRYLIPIVPILCVYASIGVSSIVQEQHRTKKYQLILASVILLGFVFSEVFKRMMMPTLNNFNWNYYDFHLSILFPLSILFIFSQLSIESLVNRKIILATGILFFISFYVSYDTLTNAIIIKNKDKIAASKNRFIPYMKAGELPLTNSTDKILIDPNLYSENKMLGRDLLSCFWMYRIYYNKKIKKDQIIYDEVDLSSLEDQQIVYYLISNKTNVVLKEQEDVKIVNYEKFILISRN